MPTPAPLGAAPQRPRYARRRSRLRPRSPGTAQAGPARKRRRVSWAAPAFVPFCRREAALINEPAKRGTLTGPIRSSSCRPRHPYRAIRVAGRGSPRAGVDVPSLTFTHSDAHGGCPRLPCSLRRAGAGPRDGGGLCYATTRESFKPNAFPWRRRQEALADPVVFHRCGGKTLESLELQTACHRYYARKRKNLSADSWQATECHTRDSPNSGGPLHEASPCLTSVVASPCGTRLDF